MPDTSKFLLTLTATGKWSLRPQAHDQYQELESTTHAAFEVEGEDPDGVVHIEAASATPSGMPAFACFDNHLIEAWLYYLGRAGHVSLKPGRRSALPQTIPRRLALTPDLIKQDPGSIEQAVLHCRGIRSPADLVRLAPKTSIAGIAARLGREAELLRLMSIQPADYWMDLVTPLYFPLTPLGDGAQGFALALTETVTGYLWLPGAVVMEHCHVRVSRDGALSVEVLPIDAFGFEAGLPIHDPRSRTDGGGAKLDGSVLIALKHVPEIAGRILRDLLCNFPTGVHTDFVDTDVAAPPALSAWIEDISEALKDDLFEIEQCLRWKIYPYDGKDRPLQLAQWLHAANAESKQLRRTQALAAMPGAVLALVSEREPRTLAAIDNATSLVDAIRETYGVPAWVARRVLKHKGVTAGDGTLKDCRWQRSAFRALVHLVHDLGKDAPALPPRHVQTLQWLIDSLQSDRRHFAPPTRIVHRALHALGRTASRSNWNAAMDMAPQILLGRLSLTLLDSIATATVATYVGAAGSDSPAGTLSIEEIVDAWLGELDADAWMSRGKRLAALTWNPTDPALAHALQMAARESRHRAPLTSEHKTANAAATRRLIWPQSLLSTCVSIYPLDTCDALDEEGARMRNCLATHWAAVKAHEHFIVALEHADSGMRANASVDLDGNGSWRIREIAGAGNCGIDHTTLLRRSANELTERMTAHPDELDQTALQAFKERSEELRRPIEIEAFDTLAVQRLPEPLAAQVLACLPGAGDLDRRIGYATRRAAGLARMLS